MPDHPADGHYVQAAYDARVAAGVLNCDPDQARVVARLNSLSQRLADYPELKARGISARNWRISNILGTRGRNQPRGQYLYGGVGRGKSMVMDLFFDTAPVVNKRRVHFHEFMRDIHRRLKQWRDMSGQERIRAGGRATEDDPIPPVARQIAREATLLCFDEFQVHDVADAMILGRLFTELFDRGVIVVATSNRIPDTLYEDGLNRDLFLPFIDLLKEKLDIIALDGPKDYRGGRDIGEQRYFTPVNRETTSRLQGIFWRLTGLSPDDREFVPTGTVEVDGRTIFVPKSCSKVAVFSFKRLCQRPLGASDYLAIAAAYRVIFIVNIPQMGPAMRNEAKRFVTLIDALYEARSLLFASAHVGADALYPAGDGSFEFARTVSRLNEMMSADYPDTRAPQA